MLIIPKVNEPCYPFLSGALIGTEKIKVMLDKRRI